MDEYVSKGGKIGDGVKLEIKKDTKPELSVFEASTVSANSIINIAGNYKYSCVVPTEPAYPPNYVGVLKENGELFSGDLIYELLTFTDAKARTDMPKINCNTLVVNTYDKLFRVPTDKNDVFEDSDTYMINFTNGLPYSFYEPGLRGIHKDVTKRINKLIDYAIRTGQDENTKTYSKGLVKLFHEIFFTWGDDKRNEQKDAVPRYYALRTGILPTAVSFAKWKAIVGDNKSNDESDDKAESLANHADGYLEEVDQLKKGEMFIPGGISEQFKTTNIEKPLFWYPFNVDNRYSYYFDDGSKKNEQTTTDDQQYVVNTGFNHFDVANNESLKTMLSDVPANTKTLNNMFVTKKSNTAMILSYESSLSTVPAPKTVTVMPTVGQYVDTKDGSCKMRGIRSKQIIAINNTNKDNIWANPINNNTATMHPLLNRAGKDSYLKITTEKRPSYITDDTFTTASNTLEETYYYNAQFPFSLEERDVDRLNYYSELDDKNEKKCVASRLEFAKITDKLFNVVDNDKLQVDKDVSVADTAFGVISKKDTAAWKTKAIGICDVKNAKKTDDLQAMDAYKDNLLFSIDTAIKTVPTVKLPIRALHYMDPVEPPSGKWNEGMTCPYRDRDTRFLGSIFNNCRKVPQLRMGRITDPMEWDQIRNEGNDWADYEVFDSIVNISDNIARVGMYNQKALYSLCKAVLDGGSMSEYYYTIHILADDGDVDNKIDIDQKTGEPVIPASSSFKYDNNNVKTNDDGTEEYSAGALNDYELKQRYGTGLQYFFAGVCDKHIYEHYFNNGLTVQQLLDHSESIGSSTNNNKITIKLSRVSGGLKRAYLTFEWDYDLLLEAWQLALWIMRGMPDDRNADVGKNVEFWDVHNAPVALAAFFDYIYAGKQNDAKLLIGPSLKQINNLVGPYGSDDKTKGMNTELNDLTGAVWKDIQNHKENVKAENTLESKTLARKREKLGWNTSDLVYGNRYINSKTDHTLVSSHIFADHDLPMFDVGNHQKLTEYSGAKMKKNGVGKNYWGKGSYSGESPWGTHAAKTYRNASKDGVGNMKLDHSSWDWPIDYNSTKVSPADNKHESWKGAFMIHAITDEGGKFNWHLGPFHTVSEEGQKHTEEYGARNGKSPWDQWTLDTENNEKDKNDCRHGVGDNKPYRMAWHGINGETYSNQNPNIRVRLPMLWRYLKALRSSKIYTDGQLMPCGVELHYNQASKSLMSSIKDTELTIPTFTADPKATTNAWHEAISNPSATVFAEVLHDTYAISKATIDKWKNIIFNEDNTNNMIKDILNTVARQKPKITAMNRAKIYIDSLVDNKIDLKNGRTVFNLPVLPVIASFGTKIPGEDEHMNTSITNTDDPLTTIGSSLPNYYKQCPSVDFGALVPVNRIGIGVTDVPQLNKGVEVNQFTAISNAMYNDVLSFDGNTFGWIIPIPHASNLALLNAYDDTWRKHQPSVIPLKLNEDEYKDTIRHLADISLHWIGWFVADYRDKLEENDIASSLVICDDANNLENNAIIRSSILKITPEWHDKEQSKDGKKPFAVKLEIDTRTDKGLEMIMIRDKIPNTDTVKVEYEINNVSLAVKLPNTTNTIPSNITNVSYDRDMYADGAIAPI